MYNRNTDYTNKREGFELSLNFSPTLFVLKKYFYYLCGMKKKVGRPPLKIKKVVASVRVLESTKEWYKEHHISMGKTLEEYKKQNKEKE